MKQQITLCQGINGNKDSVLYVSVTNHPGYKHNRLVVDTVDEAVRKIEEWLRRRIDVKHKVQK